MASKKHRVVSYHLNIGDGDCAIHLHVNADDKVQSAVLIDGGRGENGSKLIPEFMESAQFQRWKRSDGSPRVAFDAIVVTHWDDDHAKGLAKLFCNSMEAAAKDYIQKNKDKLNKLPALEADIKACKIQSPLFRYTDKADSNGRFWPLTRIYAPYWTPAASDLKNVDKEPPTEFDFVRRKDADKVNDYIAITTNVKFQGKTLERNLLSLKIPGIAGWGRRLIGLDFFTGDKVIAADKALNPLVVSKEMATSTNWSNKPAMVCVGSAGSICDPDGERKREKLVWADKDDDDSTTTIRFSSLQLIDPPGSLANKAGETKDDAKYSSRSIKGETTLNNQASVACMIFWPSSTKGNVSHYFGGDMGDVYEEAILRWSATYDSGTRRLEPIHIRAMKLSHHGRHPTSPASFERWRLADPQGNVLWCAQEQRPPHLVSCCLAGALTGLYHQTG